LLSFAIVYFFESRLFKELQAIQIKNFSPITGYPSWLQAATQRRFVRVVGSVAEFAAVEFVIPAIIAIFSALSKTMSMSSEILPAAGVPRRRA
jgi:hypothetical protein